MSRTEMLREVRMKRFEEVYDRWRRRRITQVLAANVLGVTARTFRNLPTILGHEAHGFREVFPEGRIHRPNPHPLR